VPDRIVSPDAQRGPTVQQLMIEVMRRVTFVGKEQRNTEQRFDFRGIDDVINALGPAMREVGILCLPTVEWSDRASTKTTRGKDTRETLVRTRYTFYGPRGDSVSAVTEGESLDSGDKGTAKAQTVAWRVAMIQAFALPTDEPDPDSYAYERGDDRRDDRRNGRDERRPDRSVGPDDERDRQRDRTRTTPDRVNAEDGNERGDLIDTEDTEQLRDQMLLTLKDKIRYYKIDKGRAGDTFEAIFGDELQDADPDLIERFTALIVQLGGLPDIDADPAEQHPAVTKLMAVQDAKGDVQEQMAAERDGPGGDEKWGPAPRVQS
jgi:hypothetical protein